MFRFLTLLLLLFFGGLLQSNAPIQDAPDGAGLFKKNCKVCHGKNADKETKKIPNLLQSSYDLAEMTEIVTAGKGTMPPFGEMLNESEIEAVLNYVQSLQAEVQNP